MPSLFDPDLNLQWAKKHLDALDGTLKLIHDTEKQRITTYDDTDNGWYVIDLEFPRTTAQLDAAIIAGDFINRLRAALDHLMWHLALLTTSKPSNEVCFPICIKDSLDTQVRIAKSTFGIPDEAVTVVKMFQPYKARDLYKTSHLWRLQTLSNIDKHRHIPPNRIITDVLFTMVPPDSNQGPFMQTPMEQIDNHYIVRLPLAMKENVKFNPNVAPPTFRFQDSDEGIDLGIDDLFDMHQFVADTVFPAFARFFK